ncbi:pre-16S rRNA-processing nuclease YqgF [Gloeocapsa sp. PCC 73106]|uniref:pre-16S rRNA-processing nuclease YqgF n=1 Tax=Gloeocapsa sp. PCC 73106 TaxID=102232 RepID=UPI0002AC8A63|nr:pre-16S rRNA-processing nuclease YqgF [Gloeocapsa sp. PCC 73106]ELR96778.1 putative endonuclease involved in recombination [Gloeocapsa sp. PCC 73106]
MVIIGFDPGRDKCGVAVMSRDQQLLHHQVIASEQAIAHVIALTQEFAPEVLVLGNQTTSKIWSDKLKLALPPSLPIVSIDERNSTLQARDRYWDMYPPRGLNRLVPRGMRVPPRAIDDLVAIILIERYLNSAS